MPKFDMKLLNSGHNMVDYDELLRAQVQAISEEIRKELPRIIKDSIGKGDATTSYADILHAMRVVATNFAQRLAPVTSAAVKKGAEFGRGR